MRTSGVKSSSKLLVAITVLLVVPVLALPDGDVPLRGPVRSVRTYGASFRLVNGKWVEYQRRLLTSDQYDAHGRLLEETIWDEAGQVSYTAEYGYDEKGRKLSQTSTSREGGTSREVYSYDRAGRLASVTYEDPVGTPAGRRVFSYDRRGRKVSETVYSPDRTRAAPPDTWRYDGQGRVVEQVSHDTRGAPERHAFRYRHVGREVIERTWAGGGFSKQVTQYDGRGRVISRAVGVTGGPFSEKYTYAYSRGGATTVEARYRHDQPLLVRTHFTYDHQGRVTEEVSLRPAGTVDKRTTYVYGPRGEVLEEARYGPGNSYSGKTAYTYDPSRRVTSRTVYDGQGLNNRTIYAYDAQGRLTEEHQYNGPDTPADQVTYAYDPQGRRTSEIGRLADGSLSYERHYQYDRAGRLSSEKFLLSDDPPTRQTTLYRCDTAGRRVEAVAYSPLGLQTKTVNRPPHAGRSETAEYYGDGSLMRRAVRLLGPGGRPTTERFLRGDGSLEREIRYRYDRQGRKVQATEYLGSVIEARRVTTRRFDSHGNVVEQKLSEPTVKSGRPFLRPIWINRIEIEYAP